MQKCNQYGFQILIFIENSNITKVYPYSGSMVLLFRSSYLNQLGMDLVTIERKVIKSPLVLLNVRLQLKTP